MKFADRKSIYVIGYPRSGNTWVSQLLGSALNAPVVGANKDTPIGQEGLDRPGDHVIRQAHLKPSHPEPVLTPTPYLIDPELIVDEKIVIVHRDPRDVACSVWHYWNRPSLSNAITSIGLGEKPLKTHGPIEKFYQDWAMSSADQVWISYESLIDEPVMALDGLLCQLDLVVDTQDVLTAVSSQTFDQRIEKVKRDHQQMTYNQAIQRHHLWKGRSGTWKEHFTWSEARLADELFGNLIVDLGHERDQEWIYNLSSPM